MPKMSIIYPSIRDNWMSKLADESVRYQTLKDIEVIKVTEPGLTTSEITNKALDTAQGELITWAYDDDVLLLEKCEILAMYADKYKDFDVFYAGYIGINEKNRFNKISSPPPFNIDFLTNYGNYIDTFSTAVRREKIGDSRFREDYPIMAEYLFWFELYRKGLKFKRISVPLVMYRRWDGAISTKRRKEAHQEIDRLRAEFGKQYYSIHYGK